MKRTATALALLLGISLALGRATWAQEFDFNDGTLQGWTVQGAYDENGNGPYSHYFVLGWTDFVNLPTPDPGTNLGALELLADGGHGVTGSSGDWWVMELHSPDLSSNPDWQGSSGYSVSFVENMGIRFPVYANLWVSVRDMNAGKDWTLWRGPDVKLTYSNSYDRDALWNTFEFDFALLDSAFADYVINEIHLTVRGSMTGLFDGPVAIDEIASLGPSTKSRIKVDVPNGGETWDVGSTRLIRWHSRNFAGDVKIVVTGAGVEHVVTAATTNDGTFEWTIPDQFTLPFDDAKIEIEDAADEHPYDISDLPFSIVAPAASITVDVPNGGEVWDASSPRLIRWHTQSFDAPVKIEYSDNDGVDFTTIAASVENTGTYTWTVPNTPSTMALVKISDAATGDISDTSDDVFTITPLPPTLTVDAPNGREIWEVGSTQSIQWHSVNHAGVIGIEYSTDGGGVYALIVNETPDTGSYEWTIPDTPTEQGLVRVYNSEDPATNDVSDAFFAIVKPVQPAITVVAPNGGEDWQAGTSQSISWTSENLDAPVRIEYSTDGGATFSKVTASTANAGAYTWLVPDTTTAEALVRISDAADGDPFDVSDAFFAIVRPVQPSITVALPNGGESWQTGTSQSISWTSENFDAPVRIEYSTDGGATFANVIASTPNAGAYNWLVPDTPTVEGLVRISDAADGDPSDTSDGVFSIEALPQQSITVTSPNGGESWQIGTTQTISWQSEGLTRVQIEYSTDGGTAYTDVAFGVPDTGSYDWLVPNTPTADALVRVSGIQGGDPMDVSDGFFAILAGPKGVVLVTNTNNAGPGSLRDALNQSNSSPDVDSIKFAIPETDPGYSADIGIWSIRPESGLPGMGSDGLVIDGSSQSRFIGRDANPDGPEVAIDGIAAGEGVSGLYAVGSGIRITDLIITRFNRAGIEFNGVTSGQILGCYIGADPSGQQAAGNGYGVWLYGATQDVTVGLPWQPNVLSGNATVGVFVSAGAAQNIIRGNRIGLTGDGKQKLGNSLAGITIQGQSHENEIRDNEIGGNGVGVYVSGSTGTVISDNLVGTDSDWTADLGNVGNGVDLTGGAEETTVAENVIGYNGSHGVKIAGSTTLRNTISRNSIAQNKGSGIWTTSGGNSELTPPVIVSAIVNHNSGASPSVDVIGTAAPGHVVEVFGDDGNQGQFYVGTAFANNAGEFNLTLDSTPPSVSFCTATATDTDGNTSEFSSAHLMSGVGVAESPIPTDFVLYQNYPNPFYSVTRIKYALPKHASVELTLFDIVGREMRVLFAGDKPAGEYEMPLDAGSLPAGMYFCRMRAGDFVQTRSLMLLK